MTRIKRPLTALNSKNKRRVLQLLCDQQHWLCGICGKSMSVYSRASRATGHVEPEEGTIDHIIPKSKGGGNLLANLRAAHASCNNARANTYP